MKEAEKKREERAKLLESLGIEERFESGSISIDTSICRGLECKLCIEACPTNALYWGYGEVKVVEDLCIYCTACVVNCIVDNCIKVFRRRPDGRGESYSTPRDVLRLFENINSKKRFEIINRCFS